MSRTPLHGKLARLLRLAAYGKRNGISSEELIERVDEARWSRRQFLKTAAVGSMGVAMTPTLSRVNFLQASAPKVVIVGAGTAGLACAYRLQQAGVKSDVYEASTRVGGRMFSLRNYFPDKQIAELGGELIDSNHESLLNLAKELGLTLTDLAEAGGKLESDWLFYQGKMYKEKEIIEAFGPVAEAINADLETITGDGDITYTAPNNGEALDNLSITAWLDKHNVTGFIRELLDVAYVGEYGLEADQQSSLNLLWLIGTDTSAGFKIFGESDERYHIAEGNDSVPTKLAEALKTPVSLEHKLEAIRQKSNDKYVLTFNKSGKSVDVEADKVVLALPFTLLRQVDLKGLELPEVKMKAIQELGYGTNAKLMVGYKSRLWQKSNSDGSTYTDLPYQNTWDTSLGQPGKSGIITNFTGGKQGLEVGKGSPESQAANFVEQFDKVFPGSKAAYNQKAVRFHWPSYPFTLGSYACYKPGQYTVFRGAEGEAVGNLHFAGEHTSLESQGYMNGASESGERVAQEVLESVKVK